MRASAGGRASRKSVSITGGTNVRRTSQQLELDPQDFIKLGDLTTELQGPSRTSKIDSEDRYGLGERTEEAIDEDVYGATIFSVCYDVKSIITGTHDDLGLSIHLYRLFYVLFLLFANFGMQLGLLHWIYKFVAMPQVNEVQTVYKKFHLEVFVDGVFDNEIGEISRLDSGAPFDGDLRIWCLHYADSNRSFGAFR
jgi:hypothetical protein